MNQPETAAAERGPATSKGAATRQRILNAACDLVFERGAMALNLDEILAQLEWAYDHRETLHTLGAAAGRSMESCTWQATARQFYDLISL